MAPAGVIIRSPDDATRRLWSLILLLADKFGAEIGCGTGQATIPLTRARDLAPDKTSIREALGRALFGARRYEQAAVEFEAVATHSPTNDFALFCLGRSLQMLGRHAEARKPLALAACLQPGRRDYRLYRDRARARAAGSEAA